MDSELVTKAIPTWGRRASGPGIAAAANYSPSNPALGVAAPLG
jgi:hypothetical protein